MQRTQIIQHAVKKENGIIKVGKSYVMQPKIHYTGKEGTHWYDDSKLIKKKHK